MGDKVPAPAAGNGALTQDRPRGRLERSRRAAVARYAAAHPQWDGILCLPGDPTHWVHLSAGEIVSFRSFLTFRLARAFGADGAKPEPTQMGEALARPERLASLLSSAELGGNSDEILGVLIGAELAASRVYWLGQQVAVLGEGAPAEAYATALAAQGVPVLREPE